MGIGIILHIYIITYIIIPPPYHRKTLLADCLPWHLEPLCGGAELATLSRPLLMKSSLPRRHYCWVVFRVKNWIRKGLEEGGDVKGTYILRGVLKCISVDKTAWHMKTRDGGVCLPSSEDRGGAGGELPHSTLYLNWWGVQELPALWGPWGPWGGHFRRNWYCLDSPSMNIPNYLWPLISL